MKQKQIYIENDNTFTYDDIYCAMFNAMDHSKNNDSVTFLKYVRNYLKELINEKRLNAIDDED